MPVNEPKPVITVESLSKLILRRFGEERRRVTSDWRIAVAARRISTELYDLIPREEKIRDIIRLLLSEGDIRAVIGFHGVYVITVPYSEVIPLSDEHIIQEANPFAVFSRFSALVFHSLTVEVPRETNVTYYLSKPQIRIPTGTMPEDWTEHELPQPRFPGRIDQRSINWMKSKAEWDYGEMIVHVLGMPVFVTDVERTLIDTIRFPGQCGGITAVLRAWRRAIDRLRIDLLNIYLVRSGSKILKQRAGFVLEAAGFSSPILEEWRKNMARGSSVTLLAGEPFSSQFSERWNLSLNVPPAALSELGKANIE